MRSGKLKHTDERSEDTWQQEKSKLEIVRLKAEIYDILSKNGDI